MSIYDEWANKRLFKIEQDRFKDKKYIYTSPYQVVNYGFNNKNLFPILSSDILNKAYRMMGYNVMYPVICNNLNDITYSYSRLRGENIDVLRNNHKEELKSLNVGFDFEKEISLDDFETIKFVQKTFKNMYDNGFIKFESKKVFTDFSSHQIYSKSMVVNHKDKFFLKHACEEVYEKKLNIFSLDISKFPHILDDIKNLDISEEKKEELYDYLGVKKGLLLTLEGEVRLNIKMDNPEYLAGLSFIALNPKYIDVLNYTTADEAKTVKEFIENEDSDEDCFIGLVLKNPLTVSNIYVFASYKYEEDIHVGIPAENIVDHMFAKNLGLDIYEFMDSNGILYNSDFLDGMNLLDARDAIIDAFTSEGMATLYSKPTEDLIISSYNDLGVVIPCGEDYKSNVMVLDEIYYPIYFNNRFIRTSKNEGMLDNKISFTKMTFNRGFVLGLMPLCAKYYDKMASFDEVYNISSVYNDFNDTIMILNYETSTEEILYSLIFNQYFDQRNDTKIVVLSSQEMNIDALGEQQRLGVSFVSEILNRAPSDAYRLYLLSNDVHDDYLKQTIEKLDEYKTILQEIKKAYEKPFNEESSIASFFQAFKDCEEELLKQFEVVKYTKNIITFFKNYILEFGMTKEEAKEFLVYLSTICPLISENINKEIFNNKYSIYYSCMPSN